MGCQRKTNVGDRWSAIKVENKESTDRTTNRYRQFKYVFGSPFGWDFLDKSEALHLIIRLSHHHQSAEFSQTFSAKHSVIISICAILWANKQKRDGGKVMKNRSRTVVFDWKRFQWFHLDALVLCKLDACCCLVPWCMHGEAQQIGRKISRHQVPRAAYIPHPCNHSFLCFTIPHTHSFHAQ